MKRVLLPVFCCFYITALFAQSPKAIEDDLLKSIKKIEPFVPSGISAPAHDFDSLEQENNKLSEKLLYYTAKYPFTISQKFKSFSDSVLGEVTSADGLLRIYFWNTGLGGTCRNI